MSNISRQTVHAYLVEMASSEPTYLRAREIANDLDASPKAVAQYLSQLQETSSTYRSNSGLLMALLGVIVVVPGETRNTGN
ncbi:hypothetical protein GCU68_17760 (plasmid) [Natronorubrum aibiense]|uniref:DUF7123 domain-containing protein n=1 Tax=Natronorubrum aibiense TaxID=348826 RepID=A0A5P9P8D8_9EURY|nr:hypothetical protein GCU68_17760 [Natronorubrum aibiense]